ncbi:uncharacterized protein LOC128882319, partial [Hylaeus volcanicus]|uniref:uncharacterized protein LOC128882319 n=1 Tax=Hylaeus volcanicus TaxID=313075 RepID=UPI0023B78709
HLTYDCRSNDQGIILATTQALVEDRFGSKHSVRVLIDQGSQVSMVTERLVQRLQLTRTHTPTSLYGIGGQLDTSNWSYLHELELADTNFSNNTLIDVLLGADVYTALIQEGLRKGDINQPVAQNTIFGWVLSGSMGDARSKMVVRSYQASIGDALLSLVRQFWEQEELPSNKTIIITAEQESEADFRLSRTAAYGALMRLEMKFQSNHYLEKLYKEFLNTYEDLGHMTLVPKSINSKNCFYLPHRGVFRDSSKTTKLRVVFNGSWRSASMLSLNELLHPGPNLLPNLYDVFLRWRKYQFVLVADIEKMYRQILLHPEDRDY